MHPQLSALVEVSLRRQQQDARTTGGVCAGLGGLVLVACALLPPSPDEHLATAAIAVFGAFVLFVGAALVVLERMNQRDLRSLLAEPGRVTKVQPHVEEGRGRSFRFTFTLRDGGTRSLAVATDAEFEAMKPLLAAHFSTL